MSPSRAVPGKLLPCLQIIKCLQWRISPGVTRGATSAGAEMGTPEGATVSHCTMKAVLAASPPPPISRPFTHSAELLQPSYSSSAQM